MRIACLLVLVLPLCGQEKFEVASIRPSVRGARPPGIAVSGGRVEIVGWSLRQLVLKAYEVDTYQVQGPEWIDTVRFDVSAKMPDGEKPRQVPEMLWALLAERFSLKTHRETKEMPGYSLLEARGGVKMARATREAVGEEEEAVTTLDALMSDGNVFGMDMSVGKSGLVHLEFTKMPMAALAQFLGSYTRAPVFENTGLEGRFRGSLDFTPERGGPPGPNDVPLTTAVDSLGLRLVARRGPVEVVVVEAAAKAPTEN